MIADQRKRRGFLAWRHSSSLRAFLILCGLIVAAFVPFFRSGLILYGGDMLTLNYPLLDWLGRALHSGHWPLWNPYSGGGYPLAPFSALLAYPPTWLLAIFPTSTAISLTELVDVLLAGGGTFALALWLEATPAGAVLAGGSFALSGFMAAHLYAGHFLELGVIAWMPLTLLAVHAFFAAPTLRRAVLVSLGIALQILANGVEFLPFTLFPVCGLIVVQLVALVVRHSTRHRRTILPVARLLLLSMILVVLLTAILTIPFREAVQLSVRGAGVSFADATKLSYPFHALAMLFMPDVFGNAGADTWWLGALHHQYFHEFFAYIGLVPLLCAPFAWMKAQREVIMFYIVLVAICFCLALGSATPLYSIVYRVVPGLSLVRVPDRWLLPAILGLCLLGGLGLDSLLSLCPSTRRLLVTGLTVIVGTLLLCAVPVAIFDNFLRHGDPELLTAQAWSTIWPAVIRFLGSALFLIVVLWGHARGKLRTGFAVALLLLFAFFDVGSADLPLLRLIRPADYVTAPPLSIMGPLSKGGGDARNVPVAGTRLLDLTHTVPLRLGMTNGLTRDVQDYAPITLLNYWETTHPAQVPLLQSGAIGASGARDVINAYDAPSLRLLSVQTLLSPQPLPVPGLILQQIAPSVPQWWVPWQGSWNVARWTASVYIYHDNAALPSLFLATHTVVQKSRVAALADDRRRRARVSRLPDLTVDLDTAPDGQQQPLSGPAGAVQSMWAQVILTADRRGQRTSLSNVRGVTVAVQGEQSTEATVDVAQRRLLVVDSLYTPGWVALIDGQSVALEQVSGLLQGVWIPQGRHHVQLVYAPLDVLAGGLITLGGIILTVLILVLAGVRIIHGATTVGV